MRSVARSACLLMAVFLIGVTSSVAQARRQSSTEFESTLRAAEQRLQRVSVGREKAENRLVCLEVLTAMQAMSARAYLLLQQLQAEGIKSAARELKRLDTLSMRAERLLLVAIDGLTASISLQEKERELISLHQQFASNRMLHEHLVNHYLMNRQWEQAGVESEKLLRLHPSSRAGQCAAGRSHEEHGRRTEAILAYQRALEIDDSDEEMLRRLHRLMMEEGRTREWSTYLERKSRLNPRNRVVQSFLRRTSETGVDSTVTR